MYMCISISLIEVVLIIINQHTQLELRINRPRFNCINFRLLFSNALGKHNPFVVYLFEYLYNKTLKQDKHFSQTQGLNILSSI